MRGDIEEAGQDASSVSEPGVPNRVRKKMDKTRSVDAEPAPDFAQVGEHKLALALVDCTDACLGRPFSRPHEAIGDFLLIGVELSVVVDLGKLGVHETTGTSVIYLYFYNLLGSDTLHHIR
jgi:hypothetical protein